MRGHHALREPPSHISRLRPQPFDWGNDPELAGPPRTYTRELTATLSSLEWTIVETALRNSDNRIAQGLVPILRNSLGRP